MLKVFQGRLIKVSMKRGNQFVEKSAFLKKSHDQYIYKINC